MNSESGMQDFKLPIPLANLQHGKTIGFMWTVNSNSNWRLLNSNLYYNVDPIESD